MCPPREREGEGRTLAFQQLSHTVLESSSYFPKDERKRGREIRGQRDAPRYQSPFVTRYPALLVERFLLRVRFSAFDPLHPAIDRNFEKVSRAIRPLESSVGSRAGIGERARIRGRDEDVSAGGNSFHQLYRRRAGQ